MTDIKSPGLFYLKGGLMLATGLLAASLVVAIAPSWSTVLLLAIAIWGFCRAYYFAFYVIEHYIDSEYKFSGLVDFMKYAFGIHPTKKRKKLHSQSPVEPDRSAVDH